MDVRMPDGVLLRGVPKGTPKAEIMDRYRGSMRGAPPPKPQGPEMSPVSLTTGQPATEKAQNIEGMAKAAAGMMSGTEKLAGRLNPTPPSPQAKQAMESFAQPSNPGEAEGKLTADVLSTFAPGGASSRLGRVLGQGALAGAQSGTAKGALIGAGAAGAGEGLQMAGKAMGPQNESGKAMTILKQAMSDLKGDTGAQSGKLKSALTDMKAIVKNNPDPLKAQQQLIEYSKGLDEWTRNKTYPTLANITDQLGGRIEGGGKVDAMKKVQDYLLHRAMWHGGGAAVGAMTGEHYGRNPYESAAMGFALPAALGKFPGAAQAMPSVLPAAAAGMRDLKDAAQPSPFGGANPQ